MTWEQIKQHDLRHKIQADTVSQKIKTLRTTAHHIPETFNYFKSDGELTTCHSGQTWSKQQKGQQQQDLEAREDVGRQLLDCEHWQMK